MATILVVDDSDSTRNLVTSCLRSDEFNILEADNGVNALKKIGTNKIDLVISDFYMPEMDGLDLVRNIRENHDTFALPVIILTNDGSQVKKQEGKDIGVTGWIVKPFKPEQLLEVVNKLVGR